jgi:hypothetical protein
MRPTLIVVLSALLACSPGEPDLAAQTIKIPVRGLFTAPNARASVPQGALVIADDVEVRNGEGVMRRGMVEAVNAGASAIWPFQNRLLVHKDATLSYSDEGVTALTAYAGAYSAPAGRKLKAASANGNAYLATTAGTKRLDAVAGSPVDAGVPPGLDVQGAVTGSSGFLADNAAVAYRAVWGTRDANGNLILGAPSGRAIVANTAGGSRDVSVSTSIPEGVGASHFWQLYRTAPSVSAATDPGDEMGLVYEGPKPADAAVTQLARSANVVTAQTAAAHGFAAGQTVRLSPGGANAGLVVSVGSSSLVQRSTDHGATWSTAGITGLSGDYFGIGSKGDLYVAVGVNVCSTSPDGLTWTARTIPAGTYNAVAWTGSLFVATGNGGKCATSPDGITWTARTTGTTWSLLSLAWNGSTLVATAYSSGTDGIVTSPDGITWTVRNVPFSSSLLYSLAWLGTQFVAVGLHPSLYATSPDGTAWTQRTGPAALRAIASNGSRVVAISNSETSAYYSDDGVTWSTAVSLPTNIKTLAFDGTEFVAVGLTGGATSANGASWTSRTTAASAASGISAGGGATFTAGEKTITVTDATHFTYAETGVDGTLVQAQTATPLTASVVDQIPSTFAGATLYTSQSQEGILASAYEPPAAVDLAEFRGTVFWLNTTDRATLDLYVLASGAPSGLQSGDTVTVNGMVFTAGAAEAIGTRTFQVFTAGTPAKNVADTAASLVRVVNRAQGSPVYCRDLSGTNEAPGHLQLTTRVRTDSIALAVSRSSAFALTDGTTASPETKAHELRWSANGKPDAAPILNTRTLGDRNKAGLRVLALRDYLFILKADGIWRASGDGINWAFTPLDQTTLVLAPETAAILDNTIFALSNKGVVQITDTGVTIVSGPIQDQIDRFLAEPLLSTVRTLAHAVAYESEGRYMLWLPTATTDTEATAAFVFDQFESLRQGNPVWTTRTDDASAAVVNPKDGKLYRGTATKLYRERKALSYLDYSDGEAPATIGTVNGATIGLTSGSAEEGDALEQSGQVGIVLSVVGSTLTLDRVWAGTTGAATIHKAIPSVVEFAPAIPSPGATNQFQEATFLFRYLAGGKMTAEFATEITRGSGLGLYELPIELGLEMSAGFAAVPFYGTRDYGLMEGIAFPVNLRTWIPMDQQRGERLAVRFTHKQALSPMALEGLSLVYKPTSTRLRR